MSVPRRHHFVPRAYLERFGHDGRVLVRRRDKPRPFTTSVANVAVETGFYDSQTADGQWSVALERLLAGVDGAGIAAIRTVDHEMRPPAVGSKSRGMLATVLAIQFTRTPMLREQVLVPQRFAAYAGDRPVDRELVARFLSDVHLGFRPDDNEVDAAYLFLEYVLRSKEIPTREFAVQMMLKCVDHVQPALLRKHWSLEVARKPRLITSDAPLALWRRPNSRDEFEGVGVEDAEEIRFPLDPSKQLVLAESERDEVVAIEPDRVRACNSDLAHACHKLIVGHPNRPKPIVAPKLRPIRPVLRFNRGPLYRKRADGTAFKDGEVLHFWIPRR